MVNIMSTSGAVNWVRVIEGEIIGLHGERVVIEG